MATVLVIEDNPVNMKLATLLLRNAGHHVLCAVDAEDGLLLARSEQPELILMDFQLPGMNGEVATAVLKGDPATAAIFVIGQTAMEMSQAQRHSAACDGYITKPLSYQELYAAIDSLLLTGRGHAACLGATHPTEGTGMDNPLTGSASDVPAAVDVSVLERVIGNAPEVILEFQNAFRTSAAEVALELKAACAAGQAVEVRRQAHKLRPSAHTVGALALETICAELETAGKTGQMENLVEIFHRFELELVAVNAFFDRQ